MESIDSDAYSENDEDSLPGEDEVSALFRDTAALVLKINQTPLLALYK